MRRTALALVAALLLVPTGEAGEGFDAIRAKRTVVQIAALGPRPAGSRTERLVADLVEARFRALRYSVANQAFSLPDWRTSRNVLGIPHGRVRALVTAHLDGVRYGPAANDNASGIAVLLELARVIGPEGGVLFVAFGAEERAETGSRAHLGAARFVETFSRRSPTLALNLDMVGVGRRLYVRGIERSPNRSARRALAAARQLGLRVTYLHDPGWSDHAELSRAGVPAAWIQWREDACWHRSCDRPARVRATRLEAAAAVVLAALESG